ncbi:MAG TPA: AraC family transcriptional regulator [Polyangiaceae bacterium]|jgi:AraC-like DNA-binding protein|nr:AraC family transcriptional regulator [Polyangiaceae bacterium]
MASVTDRVVPLTRGLGDDAAAWFRKVAAEPGIETKVALTEAFLRSRLPALKPDVERTRDLVERIAADRALLTVEAAAHAFGTDLRTLQRRFARFVGVSPKWVIQRYRLLEATAQLRTNDPPKLVALAAALGYADQAHFQREFKQVIGQTPGSFPRG